MKNYKWTLSHSGSSDLELTHSPIGWDEKTLTLERNVTYNSVLRSYSLSLRFVREGMDYIAAKYNADGINALVTVTVENLDKSDYSYDSFYTGILNFNTYKKFRDYVEIEIIDSDRLSRFKARDEIKLNMNAVKDLDGNTISTISTNTFTIEGVKIMEQVYVPFVSETAATPNDTVDTIESDRLVEEITWNEVTRDYDNDSGASEKIKYLAEVTITWDFTFPAGGGTMDLYAEISENGSYQTIAYTQVNSLSATNETGTYTDSRETTITLPDAGYLGRMRLRIAGTGGTTGTVNLTSGALQIFRVTDPYANTSPALILTDEAIRKAIEIMTGDSAYRSDETGRTDSENYTYVSDGDLSLIAIASGANIRGFTQSRRPLLTSFKDIFKSLYAIKPIGFWYNHTTSRWELGEIADFYKTTETVDIGEVKDLVIKVNEEYYHNEVNFGPESEIEYENVNGNQTFAARSDYNNSVQRVKNAYNLLMPFRIDDYGIELIRKNHYLNYYSKDYDEDKDIWVIQGQRDGSDFITVQGYDNFITITVNDSSGQIYVYTADTRLNLDLSPKRCMLRHTSMLSIPLYRGSGNISFISSQYNFDLGLQKAAEASVIYESDDILNADLAEPLYYPEVYEFESDITTAEVKSLLADPHGYITFTYQGATYKGYIIKVDISPYKRNAKWTLIKYNDNR